MIKNYINGILFLNFVFLVFVLIIFNGALSLSVADDNHEEKKWYQKSLDHDDENDNDRHRKRKHKRNRDDDHNNSYLRQVNNPTYEEECGACHFVYQPELLPSASWVKILGNLDDHFGETVELDDDSKKNIAAYLKSNSAEYSSAKDAVKIMRCLRNQVPLRITDIPYIIEKHHEISPDILKRNSIGSLSNCSACHMTAEEGIYEDDNVTIPKS
ncbi:MAG: diheme cytochrome c [Desulfobacterium sp.]|jgi:hypothetical protein|nr:diheme cytochrome c [Desulfobacterium sp.]